LRAWSLVVALSLGIGDSVRADQVWLRDGAVREGIIIEDAEGHIVIEVTRDGVTRAERIPRAKVQRVVWGTVPSTDALLKPPKTPADELAERARIAELTGTARAHYDFAAWCAEKKHHAEAVEAFETSAKMDAALAADALYRAVLSLVELEQIERAKGLLVELVRNNPRNHTAAIQLGRLEADNAARVATLVSLAVERFNKGEHAASVSTLVRLANIKDPTQVADAARRLRSLTGLSIAEFIVENRFGAGCPTCSKALRTGLVNCPQCKGTGMMSPDREARADSGVRAAAPDGRLVGNGGMPCKTCRGFTYIICPRCGGVGRDFGVIGLAERDVMRARLESEVEKAWGHLVEPLLTGKKELIAPLAEDILLGAKRLQYFLDALETQVAREDEDWLGAIRERRKVVGDLVDRAEAVYADRTLERLAEADRIQLEKLLLDDDTLVSEITGRAVSPSEPAPAPDQPSSRRSDDADPEPPGTSRR